MYIKPRRPTPDLERGGYLAAGGREVEASQYWLRRIADGDVYVAKTPPPASPPTQEPADAGSSVSTIRRPRTLRKGS